MRISRIERWLYVIIPNFILRRVLPKFSKFKCFRETQGTQTPIGFDTWYKHKITGSSWSAHWPIHPTSTVVNSHNIYCGIETSPGFSPGNYIQAIGKIRIGDYTQIAANVGIISANHDLTDNRKHIIKDVEIGRYCWIGMSTIILPGVRLGEYTIVAAGAVVTKSFEKGYCVIGGNPAKVLKEINPDECQLHKSDFEYHGYLSVSEFQVYQKKYLNV